MNKEQLVKAIANDCNIPQKAVEAMLNSFRANVVSAVASGDKVQLVGFFGVEAVERNERVGRNPRTKAEIKIPKKWVPKFRIGKDFADEVAKGMAKKK